MSDNDISICSQMSQSLRVMSDQSLLCLSLKMVTNISITLQTAAHDGVKLWDLRKLRNFRTFSSYDLDTPTNTGK